MTHRFPVKDIALQAGLGPATVDRVLNGRGGVRPVTVARVHHAIAELAEQESQLSLSGKRLIIDVVAEAPANFLDALGAAITEELPLMGPAVFRARTDFRTRFAAADLAEVMRRIARRGSHGVLVMAPEAPAIAAAVDHLVDRGIPVITLATDMGGTRRQGYVGLDNHRAGATAAWFLSRCLPTAARILVTQRNPAFRGEQERLEGFRDTLPDLLPDARIEVFREGQDRSAFDAALRVAAQAPVDAVYSIGGGNRRMLSLLSDPRPVLVAHDRQPDNLALLQEGRIDLLIYHDFRADIRDACRLVMAAQNGQPPPPVIGGDLRLMMPPMV